MANCITCGSNLNGAKFCPNCGAPANLEMEVKQEFSNAPAGADVRKRCIADMEHMINYFGAKAAEYDEFDRVSQEVEDRSNKHYGFLIVFTVLSVFAALAFKNPFMLCWTAVFIVLHVVLKKSNKKKLDVALARRDELSSELSEYYANYGYCSIGAEYTKPAVLNSLYELVRNGRASTPGDAINIYLADLREEEKIRLQREATAAAQETAKNSKKAARYSSANFWFK